MSSLRAMRGRVLGFVVLVLLVSAGCGGSQEKDVAYLPWHEYNAEYFREASTLQLAPGYRWPATAPGLKVEPSDGKAITYQTGCGMTDADGYWLATWEETWLRNRVARPAAAREALAQLLRLSETHLFRVSADAPTRRS